MEKKHRIHADGWAGDFSYGYYRELLRTLCEAFELRPLSEFPAVDPTADRVAFLRHDMDVSTQRAVEMARIERRHGVTSTYMVFPDTTLYSIEEEAGRLHELIDLGHEIGLHVDLPVDVGRNGDGFELDAQARRVIEDARAWLESIGLPPTESISFHKPSESLLEGPPTIEGMVNAYGRDLMRNYISDSGGRWREGPPVEWLEEATDSGTVQVLVHPIWWGERHLPPAERIATYSDTLEPLDRTVLEELVSILPAVE